MKNVNRMDDAKNVVEWFKDDVTKVEEDDGDDKMDDINSIVISMMNVTKMDNAKNVDEWFKDDVTEDDEDDGDDKMEDFNTWVSVPLDSRSAPHVHSSRCAARVHSSGYTVRPKFVWLAIFCGHYWLAI